jgi:two-component system nitrate/nitrite response regulator NarL
MKSSDRKIRVVVADDSRTALLSVCGYLEFEGQFDIVATASDGLQVMRQCERFRPELLLTDLCMPHMTGLEAATQLRKSSPELRILIFTELRGPALGEECLRCGADGFVEKSQMPERLMEEVCRLFPRIRGEAAESSNANSAAGPQQELDNVPQAS